ncbi:MAG: hypothetical protein US70_C0016G0011 [Parcubacteria group bacterium GW2011_GWD2_38_11]|nr:MAG: hypothetical protein US70_C0016G0011 [Parcubacteria group bacterium GW2011_GWD2_38_11]
MKKIIVLTAALLLVSFAAKVWAVNWEIVSIVPAPDKKEWNMTLVNPRSVSSVQSVILSKAELQEIKDYFSASIAEMIGYQFIPDPKHTGIVKAITEIEEGALAKTEFR